MAALIRVVSSSEPPEDTMTYYERRQAEWTEKYASYTQAMLTRRVTTLDKQVETKSRAAESAKWDRRGKGQRLQSVHYQRARSAGVELSSERTYVRGLLDAKVKAEQTTGDQAATAQTSEPQS